MRAVDIKRVEFHQLDNFTVELRVHDLILLLTSIRSFHSTDPKETVRKFKFASFIYRCVPSTGISSCES